MPNVYAFIPARAGSNRLPNKNALPFHGRPLYEWTVEFAIRCGLFDEIYVSSDMGEVRERVPDECIVLERPSHLADSNATLLELIQHTILHQNWDKKDILVLLPVTGPLRVKRDLEEGLQLFQANKAERTIVPVSLNLHPPALLWEIDDGYLSPRETSDDPKFTQKHKHRPTYVWNDIFILDSCQNWLDKNRNLYGDKPIPLEIPAERNMPIDYPVQFHLAETLFPPVDELTGNKEWDV